MPHPCRQRSQSSEYATWPVIAHWSCNRQTTGRRRRQQRQRGEAEVRSVQVVELHDVGVRGTTDRPRARTTRDRRRTGVENASSDRSRRRGRPARQAMFRLSCRTSSSGVVSRPTSIRESMAELAQRRCGCLYAARQQPPAASDSEMWRTVQSHAGASIGFRRRAGRFPLAQTPPHARPLRPPPQRARWCAGVAVVPDPRARRRAVRAAHLLPARPGRRALPRGRRARPHGPRRGVHAHLGVDVPRPPLAAVRARARAASAATSCASAGRCGATSSSSSTSTTRR